MASKQALKESLEAMPRAHQIEALRIVVDKGGTNMSENSNGTFVNLTRQTDELIQALESYVKYVADQQRTLQRGEQEKARLEEEYFNGNKENPGAYQEEGLCSDS